MGKTALITGASSGIGKELTLYHASKGGNLVIVARRENLLNELKTYIKSRYNVKVKVIAIDLTKPESPERIGKILNDEDIEIDYLINNAGFGGYGKFNTRELNIDLNMIDLNIKALVSLTHIFLNKMIKRNYGKIMNIASSAGFLPGPLQSVYYATKAFVISFSEGISEELKDKNITITTLCPGYTETEFKDIASMNGSYITKITGVSPKKVAIYGYKAMEKGRLIAIYPRYLSFLIRYLLPFFPEKLKIKLSKKLMEKGKIKKEN
jgi:short-subunit dehydrogenase